MSENENSFESEAKKRRQGLGSEVVHWMRDNKKWWLLPIVLAVLFLGVLVVLSGTPLSPWIYSLF